MRTAPSLPPLAGLVEALAAEHVAHTVAAVAAVLDRLRQRLPAGGAADVATDLALFGALTPAARRSIVTHPLFSHWWHVLSRHYRAGRGAALGEWVPHLRRFLVAPALSEGTWPGGTLAVPLTPAGELRLPGHPRHLVVGGDERVADVAVVGDTLVVAAGRSQLAVPLADLLGPAAPPAGGPVVARPVVAGTGIEVDATDPWAVEYLEQSNAAAREEGNDGDLRPAALSEPALAQLARALGVVAAAWPELHDVATTVTRLVVPFTSRRTAALSNTAWQGAIFLRDDGGSDPYTVERLVHESSHLHLNVVFARRQLHHHGVDERIPSPFRRGLRPVNGLYHGAYVFTMVAETMDRAFRLTGDDAYRERIPPIVRQVRDGLDTLLRDVRLTDLGRDILLDVEERACRLESVYGRATAEASAAALPDLED